MKNLLKYGFIAFVSCFFTSCDKAEYKPVKIYYQNGDTETVNILQHSKGCYLKDGCIYSIYTTSVRCGIRRFEYCN